jgi:cbb3-type cytochrome oxidase subunit 3
VVIALTIFLVVFVGLVIWVNLKPNRTIYNKLERLPLEDEEDKNE